MIPYETLESLGFARSDWDVLSKGTSHEWKCTCFDMTTSDVDYKDGTNEHTPIVLGKKEYDDPVYLHNLTVEELKQFMYLLSKCTFTKP